MYDLYNTPLPREFMRRAYFSEAIKLFQETLGVLGFISILPNTCFPAWIAPFTSYPMVGWSTIPRNLFQGRRTGSLFYSSTKSSKNERFWRN